MRVLIAAAAVVAVALTAVGVLGVAGADTTTTATTPASTVPRTVSVQGVAGVPIGAEADGPTADATYRQALAAAVADGQGKAQLLAEKTAATLGAVQSVAEVGGYIECSGELEYAGAQPDFASAQGGPVFAAGRAAPAVSGAVTPRARKPAVKRHRRRRRAKAASAATCTLSTEVSLSYQLA
jgi:hypothetical protein